MTSTSSQLSETSFGFALRARARGQLGYMLCTCALLTSCTKAPEQKSAEPSQSSSAAAATVTPAAEPAPTPPVEAPQAAAAPAPAAEPVAPATPIPAEERELYDLVMRLVQEPAAQAELAPKAKVIIHGAREIKRPLKDVKEELGWLLENKVKLITANSTADEVRGTTMECKAAKLSCVVSEPGGETTLTFTRSGDRVVLSLVESSGE